MKRKQIGKRADGDVNGLHLWAVTITNSIGGHLWITTRTPSIQAAVKKAEHFMRRHRDYHSGSQIVKVKSRGTIDA